MKNIRVHPVINWSSIAIVILSFAASFLGITDLRVYAKESANWALQARGQDIGNFIAGAFLLIGLVASSRRSMAGFYIWVGSLMYFIYAYLVYSFAVHFNYLFLVYVAILGLSVYTLIAAVAMHDLPNMSDKFLSRTVFRFAAYTLIVTGTLFELLWLGEIIPSLMSGQLPKSLIDAGVRVNPVHVIDLSVVLPGMIATGILLLRKQKIGLHLTAPWLTFSILMGASIIATMIMMAFSGYPDSIAPLIMVSLIVLSSAAALFLFLREQALPHKM